MDLVILDRDGVINEDADDYIKSPDEWHPIPGSLAAIARLQAAADDFERHCRRLGVRHLEEGGHPAGDRQHARPAPPDGNDERDREDRRDPHGGQRENQFPHRHASPVPKICIPRSGSASSGRCRPPAGALLSTTAPTDWWSVKAPVSWY